ncbi:dynamin-like 120 kDa protein, mitochondrial [Cloeon dipterum]|uniref:dynamin-like 120 kDa protein, mitochondrial n=1 Tax=Cloeon dipterum TaxID=197152 RepID=UPI00321FD383
MLRRAPLTFISANRPLRYQPQQRGITMLMLNKNRLLVPNTQHVLLQQRGAAMFIGRLLRGALKIRYLVLGGALGGGMTLQKSYEQWKENLPDMKWLEQYMPPPEKIDAFRENLIKLSSNLKDSFEVNPKLKELGEAKYQNMRDWFDRRLEEAIQATEKAEVEGENGFSENFLRIPVAKNNNQESHAGSPAPSENLTSRLERMQDELMQNQLKYQKQVDRLEKENRELRRQLLLRKTGAPPKRVKKSLIDMYSEVLDELSEFDSSYNTQDHLPRVVVVGDQSSGKTSVLEMIAQARIFPRGAGEMMTRSPVKVTLSEGPYHVAQFKDSSREFDLTKEQDLAELRREVELRMKNSVRGGHTVSNDVISMSVKGPGLQRMVLVDLPGIISTVTQDMERHTKDAIKHMSELYMSNPNAIILCIQDGSVDAERSNVTDLVSQVDPQGRRTIFVLTKVDMAEENLTNPDRIQKILAGRLFPMKALGYFAVVTGRGRKEDSIQTIKEYEEQFFRKSKIFKDGRIMSAQVTTRNLSMAVSECFWKMVRETVEQQADAFKATRFNLETEWKNNFPRQRELDRDELFEKARGEILDEMVNLSQVSAKQWEELFMQRLWEKVSSHVFENIYIPAGQSGNSGQFNTLVDIKLREWADQTLPMGSVEAGWEGLHKELQTFMKKSSVSKDSDEVLNNLKEAVLLETLKKHVWEDKAADMLRVIQLNALEDRAVHDKQHWDNAIKFLESCLKERLNETEQRLQELLGPSTKDKWIYWKYSTPDQSLRSAIRNELDKILYKDPTHLPILKPDEIITIKGNLQGSVEQDITEPMILETWDSLYRRHFLRNSLQKAYSCRKGYFLYQQGLAADECNDIVLFWRIQQMLKVTSKALRQQVVNREARRLDKEIKEVLEDFGQDRDQKEKLLTGRRVLLAEKLKRVRHIQEKLEEFVQALNKEKSN